MLSALRAGLGAPHLINFQYRALSLKGGFRGTLGIPFGSATTEDDSYIHPVLNSTCIIVLDLVSFLLFSPVGYVYMFVNHC